MVLDVIPTDTITLAPGKKLYFASDFHLGAPNAESSLKRERLVIEWLDQIRPDAQAIYLLGDIFDFWFEYAQTIPRGYIRLLGKLAEIRDGGIPVYFFTGNHDMWMFDYFPKELGIPVYRQPRMLAAGSQKLLIGHGDGLGPGETSYKVLKAFFSSRLCQWLFARIHPNLGMRIATYWSRKSRIVNMKTEEKFKGEENEYLLLWCRDQEKSRHVNYYVFGHRHLKLDLQVGDDSRYVNIGEWVLHPHYGVYDGLTFQLNSFSGGIDHSNP